MMVYLCGSQADLHYLMIISPLLLLSSVFLMINGFFDCLSGIEVDGVIYPKINVLY
ncbi:MAG: hypothetical protein ACLROH_04490 [Streptococcus sp.]